MVSVWTTAITMAMMCDDDVFADPDGRANHGYSAHAGADEDDYGDNAYDDGVCYNNNQDDDDNVTRGDANDDGNEDVNVGDAEHGAQHYQKTRGRIIARIDIMSIIIVRLGKITHNCENSQNCQNYQNWQNEQNDQTDANAPNRQNVQMTRLSRLMRITKKR